MRPSEDVEFSPAQMGTGVYWIQYGSEISIFPNTNFNFRRIAFINNMDDIGLTRKERRCDNTGYGESTEYSL